MGWLTAEDTHRQSRNGEKALIIFLDYFFAKFQCFINL